MDAAKNALRIKLENFNVYTFLSLLLLVAGVLFYVGWVVQYGVFYDIGIYSITIVFVLGGALGAFISLLEK